jgi:hypothetical protein
MMRASAVTDSLCAQAQPEAATAVPVAFTVTGNLNFKLGFTALPWAPLGWRQLRTYQDVFC